MLRTQVKDKIGVDLQVEKVVAEAKTNTFSKIRVTHINPPEETEVVTEAKIHKVVIEVHKGAEEIITSLRCSPFQRPSLAPKRNEGIGQPTHVRSHQVNRSLRSVQKQKSVKQFQAVATIPQNSHNQNIKNKKHYILQEEIESEQDIIMPLENILNISNIFLHIPVGVVSTISKHSG